MTLTIALVLLVGGLLAGFLTGLLGVGGGVVMVPLIYEAQLYQGASSKTAFITAVATSLAVIVFSGAFAARIHYRNGSLELRLLLWTCIGTVIGGVLGSNLLIAADDRLVRLAFGIFLWVLAAAMFLPPVKPREHAYSARDKAGLVLTGACMGLAAAVFGIGGALLVVTALVLFFGIAIHSAIATATALIVATALTGASSYLVLGGANYINPIAVLLLLPGALIAARFGIKLAMRLSREKLRYVVVAFQLAVGARFIFF
ncbi:MAG: sulfite exporter TauE/SafE family protein [Burkholderiales bacterium]